MQPLRVLYVIGGLDPRAGGPPSVAQNVCIAAKLAGAAVTTAFPVADPLSDAETAAVAHLRGEGVELRAFRFARGPSSLQRWGLSWQLLWWLLRSAGGFDVVHVHAAWMLPSLVALLAAKLHGVAFVLTPHESLTQHDVAKGKSALRHSVKKLIRSLYLKLCDLIVVASLLEKRDSIPPGTKIDCAVLHHPVCDAREVPKLPRTRHPCMIRLRAGFLGRFDPKKNLELLLKAVSGMDAIGLHIAGDGPNGYRAHLHAFADALRLADRIEWRGFISAAQRPNFFDALDVLVMPSSYECFGMAAAEAICQGVPVIVSANTGIAELVARHGCGIVAAPDAEQIRAALARMYAEPQAIHEFSRRAIDAGQAELSLQGYGAKLLGLYERIVRPHSADAVLPARSGSTQ